jgi:hypothetical protein
VSSSHSHVEDDDEAGSASGVAVGVGSLGDGVAVVGSGDSADVVGEALSLGSAVLVGAVGSVVLVGSAVLVLVALAVGLSSVSEAEVSADEGRSVSVGSALVARLTSEDAALPIASTSGGLPSPHPERALARTRAATAAVRRRIAAG